MIIRFLVRWFGSLRGFYQFLAILVAGVAGAIGVAWWAGIFLPAVSLTLLSWRHEWEAVVGKASSLDADWRELAELAWAGGHYGKAVELFARGHSVWLVTGAKAALDGGVCALSFVAGIATAWLWGIGR